MNKSTNPIHPHIAAELQRLPAGYDDLSREFRLLLAVMRVLGFFIVRADEAQPVVSSDQDLWAEHGHPSVWIESQDAHELQRVVKNTTPGSKEYTNATNRLLTANLSEQLRLLDLLDNFYDTHTPVSTYSRLTVQTVGLGGTYLKTQGADVRVVLGSEKWQRQLFEESNAEMVAFTHFLCAVVPDFVDE